MSEEIFIKEDETPKPAKKKRVLTEKQKEGLAKGRAKMAEKRRLKKEIACWFSVSSLLFSPK